MSNEACEIEFLEFPFLQVSQHIKKINWQPCLCCYLYLAMVYSIKFWSVLIKKYVFFFPCDYFFQIVICACQMAEITHVDAVWPGWGHASENPELPDALDAKGIVFLGPPATSMAALGDKIGSSLIAQAADVPTLPWSGSHVILSRNICCFFSQVLSTSKILQFCLTGENFSRKLFVYHPR